MVDRTLAPAAAHRPTVMGTHGVVCSGHHLASQAGSEVLAQGGNAMDAALAASGVLTVVRPHMTGIGGDLFMLWYDAGTRQVRAVNAAGPAPATASIAAYRERGMDMVPAKGVFAVETPGCVAGWQMAADLFATRPLRELLQPAIATARDGFPMYATLNDTITAGMRTLNEPARNLYAPGGQAISVGHLLKNAGLADSLSAIAEGGADAFYRVQLRPESPASSARKADFSLRSTSKPVRPRKSSRSARRIAATRSGIFRRSPRATFSSRCSTSSRATISTRSAGTSLRRFTSWSRRRKSRLPTGSATAAISARGSTRRSNDCFPRIMLRKREAGSIPTMPWAGAQASRAGQAGGDTTLVTVMDAQGNAVALIQSLYNPFGSGVMAGDTGIVLNNRLSGFWLQEGHPNALEPGKRTMSTLNSFIVTRDDDLFMSGGTPGGDQQVQTNLQMLSNVIDYGMDPQLAAEATKWHSTPGTVEREQVQSYELHVEPRMPLWVREELERRGHTIRADEDWSIGSHKVIVKHPESRVMMAGASPSRDAYAVGR